MLKKIIVMILVIAAIGAVMANFSKNLAIKDVDSKETSGTDPETTSPVVLPGDKIVLDPEYSGEIVYDFRDHGFDTIVYDDALCIKLNVEIGSVYDIVWYCDPTLDDVITDCGGLYRFSYTLEEPESDVTTWNTFENGMTSGEVLTDSFETYASTVYLYIFEADENTDLDLIYTDGQLLSNFEFVLLKRG